MNESRGHYTKEINQTEKGKLHGITHMCNPKNIKNLNRRVVIRR